MKTKIFLTAVVLLAGCGRANKDEVDQTSQGAQALISDESLAQDSVSTNVDEGVSALADEVGGASLGLVDSDELSLTGAGLSRDSTFTKTCEVKDGAAVVTIHSDFSWDKVIENLKKRLHEVFSGKGDQTRTWTKVDASGAPVAMECNTNGRTAKIDWKNVAGLKLSLVFERARARLWEMTNKKTNVTTSFSHSFSAIGSRLVVWDSQIAKPDDATSIVRHKTITSTAKRTLQTKKKDGTATQMNFEIATKDGSPLSIEVVRKAVDLSLVSKTIQSGVLVAKNGGEGRVETSFDTVKISFASGECQVLSGSIITKIFADNSDNAVKTYKLTIDGGDYSLVDVATGDEKTDFDLPGCDPEDFVQ